MKPTVATLLALGLAIAPRAALGVGSAPLGKTASGSIAAPSAASKTATYAKTGGATSIAKPTFTTAKSVAVPASAKAVNGAGKTNAPQAFGTGVPLGSRPKVGDKAPYFNLASLDGKETSTKDYAGKNVVMLFGNPGGGANDKYSDGLDLLQQKYSGGGNANTQVIRVQTASAAASDPYSKDDKDRQSKLATTVDTNDKLSRQLGVSNTPSAVVIGADGKVHYKGAIDDSATNTDPAAKKTNYVDDAVTALEAGKEPAVGETPGGGDAIDWQE